MKRIAALLMALLLMSGLAAALADAGTVFGGSFFSQPVEQVVRLEYLIDVKPYLKPPYAAYTGPDKYAYIGAGKYKDSVEIKGAYYRENGFVYCETQYGQQRQRIYISEKNFSARARQAIPEQYAYGKVGTIRYNTEVREGPGSGHGGSYRLSRDSSFKNNISLRKGTSVLVLWRDYASIDGEKWYMVEFSMPDGKCRGWVPAYAVSI